VQDLVLEWKFVLLVVGIIFNAGLTVGGIVWIAKNHIKHTNSAITAIKNILCDPEKGIVVKLARLDEKVTNLEKK
jgi:hypothetical protein